MKLSLAILTVALGAAAFAEKGPKVPLWPEGKMPDAQAHQKEAPYLTWFTPQKRTSDAILIAVSGGAYVDNSPESFEVVPLRDWFLEHGVTVVTMKYRAPRPKGLPKHISAWQDAQRTVRLVRREAKNRGLNPEKIGFSGASAGGHLALVLATSALTPAYAPVDEVDAVPCHLNWAIPIYPAYGLEGCADSQNLKACDALTQKIVPEFAFDAMTPPLFLIHGDADGISPMTSVRAYHRLRTLGIPGELHILAGECHCFMLDPTDGTPAANWVGRVWDWAVKMNIATAHPMTWNWENPLKNGLADAEFEKDAWRNAGFGLFCMTAEKDSALWLKGTYGNFILDFEYKLDPGANSGVILYVTDKKNWIPNSVEVQLLDDYAAKWAKDPSRLKNGAIYGHEGPAKSSAKPAGQWNHATIYAEGQNIRVVINGVENVNADLKRYTSAKTNPDGTPIPSWLSNPLAKLPTSGAVGFQGMHGGARPYFRNIRIRRWK